MADGDKIKLGNHEYEIEGAFLVAERYDDYVELRISCTSGDEATTAWFVQRGPRGGVRSAYGYSMNAATVEQLTLRLIDARRHIRIVDAFRKETWPR